MGEVDDPSQALPPVIEEPCEEINMDTAVPLPKNTSSQEDYAGFLTDEEEFMSPADPDFTHRTKPAIWNTKYDSLIEQIEKKFKKYYHMDKVTGGKKNRCLILGLQ